MRLIDADALREDILHDNTFDNDTVNYYLAMVDGMETSYDVDRVVERIEERKSKHAKNIRLNSHEYDIERAVEYAMIPYDNCLNIVKGAVKE